MATDTQEISDGTRLQLEQLMAGCTLPIDGQPEIVTTIDQVTWAINAEEAWTYGDRSTKVTADRTDSGF